MLIKPLTFLFTCLVAGSAFCQQPTLNDPLLEHLDGQWVLRGTVAGKETTHDVQAEWVLAHQYLKLHETAREKNAKGQPLYEANVYIGWDQAASEYRCVWLDVYGGISVQSIGRATPSGDSMAFVFTDKKGNVDFHTVFTYDKETNTWTMQMDNEEKGKLSDFARTTLTKP